MNIFSPKNVITFSEVIEEHLLDLINSSPVVSIIIDESMCKKGTFCL